jgi:hypothetical protein
MTLVSSGTINLKGSAADPTRSIEYECEGAVSGDFALTTAQSIASAYVGSLPTGLTDFYGYSACSDPTPGTISSVTGVDSGPYATCTYTTSSNADNYRVQYAISPFTSWNPTLSGGAYDLASPYTTTLGNGTWRFRVCGENCSGLGSYTQSASFTMS